MLLKEFSHRRDLTLEQGKQVRSPLQGAFLALIHSHTLICVISRLVRNAAKSGGKKAAWGMFFIC